MKPNWPLKVIILLSLLIPLAFSRQTFDQFGAPKMTIFCLAVGLLILMVLVNNKSLIKLPKYLIWAFSLFVLVQAIQTLRLSNIWAGLFGAYGQSESFLVQLGFIIICLASYLFISDELDYSKIRAAILITVCFVSIYGIFQYLYGDPLSKTVFTRAESLLGDPNALGAFLILTLPMVITEFKQFYRQPQGYLIAGCLFSGIIALFLSFSRSAWLGFILSLIPFIYQVVLRFRHRSLNKQNKGFIIVVLLIIMTGLFTGQILTNFQPVSHKDYTLPARVSSLTHGNDSGRTLIWSTAWQVFKRAPFFGYGIGSFQVNFHYFKSVAAIKFWSPERNLREVHNETLHYLTTQGVTGLLAYLGLLSALFFTTKINKLFSDILPFEKTALWSAIIGYLCYVQFNYPLIHYSFLFWIYWGILLRFAVPPSNGPIKHNFQPALAIIAVLFIGIWSYFSLNIFRADVFYRKAFEETRFHNYEQSSSNYQRAISLTPWVFHYRYRYGVSLFRAAVWESKNNHPELTSKYLHLAKATLLDLTKANPDHYESMFLLGQVNESLGDLTAAASYYRQALHLYPLNYRICYCLAKVSWLLGNNTEFYKAFQTGAKIAPDYMNKMISIDQIVKIP